MDAVINPNKIIAIITITELVGAINNKVNAATPKDKAIKADILAPILSLNTPKITRRPKLQSFVGS